MSKRIAGFLIALVAVFTLTTGTANASLKPDLPESTPSAGFSDCSVAAHAPVYYPDSRHIRGSSHVWCNRGTRVYGYAQLEYYNSSLGKWIKWTPNNYLYRQGYLSFDVFASTACASLAPYRKWREQAAIHWYWPEMGFYRWEYDTSDVVTRKC